MRLIPVLLGLILLAGCATEYQPSGMTGGYTETPLAANAYRVTFQGNGYTTPDRSADFTLLRAADLTLEKGYAYFVADKPLETDSTWPPSNAIQFVMYQTKPNIPGLVYEAQLIHNSLSAKYGLNGAKMASAGAANPFAPTTMQAQPVAAKAPMTPAAPGEATAQAKTNTAAADCRKKRLSGELHGFVESANCSNAVMIAAYREINYPAMDLIYLTAAYRLALYSRVDGGQLTEAQAQLRMTEFNGRVNGEMARRRVAMAGATADSPPPEIAAAHAYQQMLNGLQQSQGIACTGAGEAVHCE